MAVNLSFIGGAGWQFLDNTGNPLSGGKIYTYAAGTTTPQTTYTSRTGLIANTNPIILDAAGRTPEQIWSTEGLLYKYVVADSNDAVIRTWDNIGGSVVASDLAQDLANTTDNAKGDALVGFKQSNASGFLTNAVARTVNGKLQEIISVKDFGALGNGTGNDATAINAAITAAIAAGGAIVYFPPGQYKCTTRIGTFVTANNVTLFGYGAEIQHYAGITTIGLITFGDPTIAPSGMWSGTGYSAKEIKILGFKFTTSNGWNTTNPGRWADSLPLGFHTSENVLIKDCSFTNYDFSAIDFGAPCRNVLVDACTFTCDLGRGNVVYGVRPFCYGTTTNYQNGNGDLSPTSMTTGILKPGYALIPETNANWGHENISVTNSHFENLSHGIMVSAARWGVISGNTFKNFETRGVSLTTYSQEYLCTGNVFVYNSTEQTSLSVSTFYGVGQATYRHVIDGDLFITLGTSPVGTGFNPVYFYFNSHEWTLQNCVFYNPSFTGAGGSTTVVVDANADGTIKNNRFDVVTFNSVSINPIINVSSPAYQQQVITIDSNIFNQRLVIYDTTTSPSPIIITNNTFIGDLDIIATSFNAANAVAKLYLKNNNIFNQVSPGARYIFNNTANKAVILFQDVISIVLPFGTAGLTNPGSQSITLDFSSYNIPASFTTKRYDFTVYGGGQNAQTRDGMSLLITAETATSVTFTVTRSTGASFQTGDGTFTINLYGLIT